MAVNAVIIHAEDNVAVAVAAIRTGEAVTGVGRELRARQDIPRNHKIALREIPAGAKIVKYGEAIGVAISDLRPGDWVHTHNLKAEEN